MLHQGSMNIYSRKRTLSVAPTSAVIVDSGITIPSYRSTNHLRDVHTVCANMCNSMQFCVEKPGLYLIYSRSPVENLSPSKPSVPGQCPPKAHETQEKEKDGKVFCLE